MSTWEMSWGNWRNGIFHELEDPEKQKRLQVHLPKGVD